MFINYTTADKQLSSNSSGSQKVDEDLEFVERAQAGDRGAFRSLVDKYQQAVATTVVSMLGPSADVDDVVQDTFIKCYQSLDRFRGDSSFLTYLKKIAINKSLDVLRRRKRFRGRFLSRDDAKKKLAEPQYDAGVDQEAAEHAQLVHAAIDKLSPGHKAVIVLRMIEGYSTEETAEMLKIPYGTVLSRLSRAQKKLKDILSPYLSSLA